MTEIGISKALSFCKSEFIRDYRAVIANKFALTSAFVGF